MVEVPETVALGHATTAQLVAELSARKQMDHLHPDYRSTMNDEEYAALSDIRINVTSVFATDGSWLPVETAPKDGTILELVVDYTDGHGPLQDAVTACTIGWNSFADTEVDEWQIVGWDWCQDHIRAGAGKILAWRPSRLMATDSGIGPVVREVSQ